jgi:hypothetical protein
MKTLKVLPISLLASVLMTVTASALGQEVIPITATLPIKAAGDSCAELNLGTTANPNLIAAEGVAITSDRASLLTCQAGTWAKQKSGGYGCFNITLAGDPYSQIYRAFGAIATGTFTGIISEPGGYTSWLQDCGTSGASCVWNNINPSVTFSSRPHVGISGLPVASSSPC